MLADERAYRRVFVGREDELGQLKAAFDGARSGRGGLARVSGEPGVGKSALCDQLARYVGSLGGHVLVGRCYEEGSLTLPYLPFVEALRSYVLTQDPAQLRRGVGVAAADAARIVPDLRDKLSLRARAPGDQEKLGGANAGRQSIQIWRHTEVTELPQWGLDSFEVAQRV